MTLPFPPWLHQRLPADERLEATRRLLEDLRLNTVCQSALCPNVGECFARGTATFMILGETCTRNCRFCGVQTGRPEPPDPEEPYRVAEAAARLALRHVVITSVTRDDLADGGAGHFAATIAAVRSRLPKARVEVLIPDFQGDREALETVLAARPDVLNHNLETVPRLYPTVRSGAGYRRSLDLLGAAKKLAPAVYTKSGLMVGLGETLEEVEAVMRDLRQVGCDLITIGQYLRPSPEHLEVVEYVAPETFEYYRARARELGFLFAACAPLVRSSYQAEEFFLRRGPLVNGDWQGFE